MSATAILSAFLLFFSLVLMVESCMKMHEGVHTTHGFPVSDDVTAKQGKNGKNNGRNSGPVPAHPFRYVPILVKLLNDLRTFSSTLRSFSHKNNNLPCYPGNIVINIIKIKQ